MLSLRFSTGAAQSARGAQHPPAPLWLRPCISVPRSQSATVAPQLQNCIAEIVEWCGARSLQLNTSKTDLLWYGSSTALKSLSSSETNIVVGNDTIVSADNVRDLGVQFDCELNMSAHTCIAKQRRRALSAFDVYGRFVIY